MKSKRREIQRFKELFYTGDKGFSIIVTPEFSGLFTYSPRFIRVCGSLSIIADRCNLNLKNSVFSYEERLMPENFKFFLSFKNFVIFTASKQKQKQHEEPL
jgi:hypothetical protein